MKIVKLFQNEKFLIFFSIFLTFPLVFATVWRGEFAFSYDGARDYLLALDNLEKITLIGPTTGIPGFFYGPYWIWILSIGLLFSKDPRFVVFLTQTLPYFTILPFILFKLRKIWGIIISTTLFTAFMLGSGNAYAVQIWNPHLGPLLLFSIFSLLIFTDLKNSQTSNYIKIFLIGILTALMINFHFSFGVVSFLAVFLFLGFYFAREIILSTKNKRFLLIKYWKIVAVFLGGFIVIFLPFLVFEIRHDFLQAKTAISFFASDMVIPGVSGMDKYQIITEFFKSIIQVIKIPLGYTYTVLSVTVLFLIYKIKTKKIMLDTFDNKLLVFIFSITCSTFFVYLVSHNPVWSYHFIGVEITFLLLIGFLMKKIQLFKIIICTYVVFILLSGFWNFSKSFDNDPRLLTTLAANEHIVSIIDADQGGSEYSVYAYSPSLYSYEYAYLFKWIAGKDLSYDQSMGQKDTDLVYLILPVATDAVIEDFINYRTPWVDFETINSWKVPNGTVILKRQRN